MPDSQGRILLDSQGREVRTDGPIDDMALPHVVTFASMIGGGNRTYWHQWDEAMRHSHENALAARREPFIMRLLDERKEAVVKSKWHLEVDIERDRWQKFTKELLTKVLKGIPRFKRYRRQLQEAVWYGRYGVQHRCGWGQVDGQKVWTVKEFVPVNGDKIGHLWDGTPYVLVHSSEASKLKGAEIVYTTRGTGLLLKGRWREFFTLHSHNPNDADYFEAEMAEGIHGVGIRSMIYWLYWMITEYASWVVDSMERIGLGLVVIYFDASNPAAEAQAKDTAKNFSRRSVLVVPRIQTAGSGHSLGSVEVVEAPTAGAAVVLELQKYGEQKIERYIVGQSMSGGADNESGLGGTGRANFAAGTKNDIIAADADDLAETLTGSEQHPNLLWVVKKYTCPWADFPVRFVHDLEEPSPEQKLGAVSMAFNMGVAFKEDEVRAITGMSDPANDDVIISAQELQRQQLEVQQEQAQQQQAMGGQAASSATGVPTGPPAGGGGVAGQQQPTGPAPSVPALDNSVFDAMHAPAGQQEPDEDEGQWEPFTDQEGVPGIRHRQTGEERTGEEPPEIDDQDERLLDEINRQASGGQLSYRLRYADDEPKLPNAEAGPKPETVRQPTIHIPSRWNAPGGRRPTQLAQPTAVLPASQRERNQPWTGEGSPWEPFQSDVSGQMGYRHKLSGERRYQEQPPQPQRLRPETIAAREVKAASPPAVTHAQPWFPNAPGTRDHRQTLQDWFPEHQLTDQHLAGMVGAQKGWDVHVQSNGNDGVHFHVDSPDHSEPASRTLKVGKDGQLVMHNNSFFLKRKSQAKGLGLRAFRDEVQNLLDLGVARIETVAGKSGGGRGTKRMNGYEVWPKMGYDMALTPGSVPAELEAASRSSLGRPIRNLSDLLETPGGKEWWKKRGDQVSMTFDLKPGSRSIDVLNRYLAAKGLPTVAPNQEAYQRQSERAGQRKLRSHWGKIAGNTGIDPQKFNARTREYEAAGYTVSLAHQHAYADLANSSNYFGTQQAVDNLARQVGWGNIDGQLARQALAHHLSDYDLVQNPGTFAWGGANGWSAEPIPRGEADRRNSTIVRQRWLWAAHDHGINPEQLRDRAHGVWQQLRAEPDERPHNLIGRAYQEAWRQMTAEAVQAAGAALMPDYERAQERLQEEPSAAGSKFRTPPQRHSDEADRLRYVLGQQKPGTVPHFGTEPTGAGEVPVFVPPGGARRKGPTSVTEPGAFAPRGEGLMYPGLARIPEGAAKGPQPPALAEHVQTPAAPKLPAISQHLQGQSHQQLSQLLADPGVPWHAMPEEEHEAVRQAVAGLKPSLAWQLLSQVSPGAENDHHRAKARELVQRGLMRRGRGRELSLSAQNEMQAHQLDLSQVPPERRAEVEDLLGTLPKVRAGRDAYYVPEGVDLAAATGLPVTSKPMDEGQKQAALTRGLLPRKIGQHLADEELRGMKADSAAYLTQQFNRLPPDEDWAETARLGQAKSSWYADVPRALSAIFGKDMPRFAALLAAKSPRSPVRQNLLAALQIWGAWNQAGRPTDSLEFLRQLPQSSLANFPSHWNNTVRALTLPEDQLQLSGEKVESFRRNLIGDANHVTNDVWMAHFAGVDQKKFLQNRPGYAAMTAKVRHVAAGLGMKPAEVQGAIWSAAKALSDAMKAGASPADAVQNAATSNDVQDTADFVTLLRSDRHVLSELERAGLRYRPGKRDAGQRTVPSATPDAGVDPRAEAGGIQGVPEAGDTGGDSAVAGRRREVLERVARRIGRSQAAASERHSVDYFGLLRYEKRGQEVEALMDEDGLFWTGNASEDSWLNRNFGVWRWPADRSDWRYMALDEAARVLYGWVEAEHPRTESGEFKTKGDSAAGDREILGLIAKGTAAGRIKREFRLELGLSGWGKALYQRSPESVQRMFDLGLAIHEQGEHFYQAGQLLAKEVARESGLPDTEVTKLGAALAWLDMVTRWGLNWQVAERSLAALGGPVVLAAAKGSYYFPAASAAYVGYHLTRAAMQGRSPLDMIRKARARIREAHHGK
jgi:hypothetical protein